MSKIKRYAIDVMGEDGFDEYLELKGENGNGKHN